MRSHRRRAARRRLADGVRPGAGRRSPSCAGRTTSSSSRTRRTSKLVGDRDVLGRPVREALPELAGQGFDRAARPASIQSGEPFVGQSYRVRLTRGRRRPPEERFFDFVYQPMRRRRRRASTAIAVVGHRGDRQLRARRAGARPDASRQPGEGRVPRDARPRAAQPARADPHRAAAAAAARRRGGERERDDHRAAGAPPGAARRRPARRLAHHARQGRAEPRAASSSPQVVAQGDRAGEPAARAAPARTLETSTCRAQGLVGATATRRGWRRCVSNLLTNAAKYTAAGRPHHG